MNDTPINPGLENDQRPTYEEQLTAEINEYAQIRSTLLGIIEQKSARLASLRSKADLTAETPLRMTLVQACAGCPNEVDALYVDGHGLFCKTCMENEESTVRR